MRASGVPLGGGRRARLIDVRGGRHTSDAGGELGAEVGHVPSGCMCSDGLGTISGLMKGERRAQDAPGVESPLNVLQGGLVGVPGYCCLSCSVYYQLSQRGPPSPHYTSGDQQELSEMRSPVHILQHSSLNIHIFKYKCIFIYKSVEVK